MLDISIMRYTARDFQGARALLMLHYGRDSGIVGHLLGQHEQEQIARSNEIARRMRDQQQAQAEASGTRTPTQQEQLAQQVIQEQLGDLY